MPDFLRVTTPLINKNQAVVPKTGIDPTGAFSIQNTTKVIQPHNQSELLKQNNGLNEGNAPTLLLNLLKDPSVTSSYLKNVYMLEELYKLLPANNKTVTNEIHSIFNSLFVTEEGLVHEMLNQENNSTAFKGDFFDFLRKVSTNNIKNPDIQVAIARLLRSMNSLTNRQDILDSIANNLVFIKSKLGCSKTFTDKLDALINGFRSKVAPKDFPRLKAFTLHLIKEIENSILYSPKLEKTLSILKYNLSRYNINSDYAAESAFRLRQYLSQDEKKQFNELFQNYIDYIKSEEFKSNNYVSQTKSKVMDEIIKLLIEQSENTKMGQGEHAKIESILYSLLSSPCNFTPLLHYILPINHNDMKAFAEIWINPESDSKDMPQGVSKGMHLLMVIDIDTVGRFEAEFFVYDSTIDFYLYCPPGCENGFNTVISNLPKFMEGTNYQMGKTEVTTLKKTRSLMEVFKSLPYRRVGLDVKI